MTNKKCKITTQRHQQSPSTLAHGQQHLIYREGGAQHTTIIMKLLSGPVDGQTSHKSLIRATHQPKLLWLGGSCV